MNIIETVFIGLVVINIIVLFIKKDMNKKYSLGILLSLFTFFILYLLNIQSRWQTISLYLSYLIIFILDFLLLIKSALLKKHSIVKKIFLVFSTILVFVTIVSSIVLPVNKIPTPSGNYRIGTKTFNITDTNRLESYGNTTYRRIRIQLFYPSDVVLNHEQSPWFIDGKGTYQGLASSMNLPSFLISHTKNIMSNSYIDAPISSKENEYPVIVLSHGWSSLRNLHVDLAEEFASNGYVVVLIEHTYGSLATVFNEDDIVNINYDALPETSSQEEFMGYANKLVLTYASDVKTALDTLAKFNDGVDLNMFKDRLDLSNIGLLGHSTGGGGDVSLALNDTRIKALVGLDAWVEPISKDQIDKGLNIPTLFFRSESWQNLDNNLNLYDLIKGNENNSYLYQIDGTIHTDFSMVYMFDSPLARAINLTGTVKKDTLLNIEKTMLTSFFNKNLKNKEAENLDNLATGWKMVRRITL